ncbi:disease resistance protein At4g27190-like [Tasmannia lanceolata]|uniref:disease resistance protein At4g27190-like n=1 Tax=Tasmannia lanceolata TaxID=3420 RepID=UPI00406432B9
MLTSQVGALKELEVLALEHGTKIDFLPIEIGELTKLRLLHVSFCHELKVEAQWRMIKLVPDGVISRLSLLEDLCIKAYPGDGRCPNLANGLSQEICSLRKLTHLGFCFAKEGSLEQFVQGSQLWKEKRLTAFQIVVGTENKSNYYAKLSLQASRILTLGEGTAHANAIVEVRSRADALILTGHGGVRHLLEFGVENLNKLIDIIISKCQEMETIVDWNGLQEETTSATAALPKLEKLDLIHLPNLRSLWEGLVPPGTLASLRKLKLSNCPKLRKLFSWRGINLQQLPNLEELYVDGCGELEEIVVNEELPNLKELYVDGCGELEEIVVNEDKVDQLQHDDDDEEEEDNALPLLLPKLSLLDLRHLPQLGSICKGVSLAFPALETIFVNECPNLKKLPMGIQRGPNFRMILGKRKWCEALEWENNAIKQQLQPFFTTWKTPQGS